MKSSTKVGDFFCPILYSTRPPTFVRQVGFCLADVSYYRCDAKQNSLYPSHLLLQKKNVDNFVL